MFDVEQCWTCESYRTPSRAEMVSVKWVSYGLESRLRFAKSSGRLRNDFRHVVCLVAAGVVLGGHENEAGSSFGGTLRGAAASLQDADDRGVSRDDTNSNRGYYSNAENQRHEERNHGHHPVKRRLEIAVFRCYRINFRLCGFFNLPSLTVAAVND